MEFCSAEWTRNATFLARIGGKSNLDLGLGLGKEMSSQISVSSELLATYAGLGTYDGGQYYRGEECHGELESPGPAYTAPHCGIALQPV